MPAPAIDQLCDDLAAEQDDLDALVAALEPPQWDTVTPAPGWAIRDQVHHLGWFDRNGALAIRRPDAFVEKMNEMIGDFAGFESQLAAEAKGMKAEELLDWWRGARAEVLDALRTADPSLRVPWYGPPMSLTSFATARLMETWAHGQDVADALGATRAATVRLRHIAHIGVRTRGFSYAARGITAPDGDVRVELDAPDGGRWEWGDAGVRDRIAGTALDFCLVVTQRRHVADTALAVDGPAATEWMAIAQAFAGAPGAGRAPGQFA